MRLDDESSTNSPRPPLGAGESCCADFRP
jgi:hypothetical protein